MLWLPLLLTLSSDLDALLSRGELTLIETHDDGRLQQATAIGLLDAPVEAVWQLITDFEAYPGWMPKVATTEVRAVSPGVVEVDWALSIAGPDVHYSSRHTLDKATWTVKGEQIKGELAGSRWDWRLEPQGSRTLVYREVFSNVVGSSWVFRQLDDEDHTLEYGINSATGVIELQALRRALE
ncbi:MAG: SRPBCC family protein [Alphaproteobacteria bacterium]|nr:SRPBCC family protein [Alphaproteobacteria bacterium]